MEKRGRKDYFKLTEKERLKIKRVISKVIKKNSKIKTAIIFGSFINRKYFRDIDIAVIGKLTFDQRMNLETELSKKTGFEIEIKSFPSLDKIPESFKFSIFQGEIIKKSKDVNFENYMHNFTLSYIDFLEFRSRKWW